MLYFSKYKTNTLRSFFAIVRYNYFIYDILESKHEDQLIKIDPKSFDLLLSKIQKRPFNEKILSAVAVDSTRTRQGLEKFRRVINVGYNNVDKIEQFKTASLILSQMCLQNYNDKQVVIKFAERGFEILKNMRIKNQMKPISFFRIKFLIGIQKLVGLHQFTDDQYEQLQFESFKPLFLIYTLELFYKHKNTINLEEYPFLQRIIGLLNENYQHIPFIDIQHITQYAVKVVSNIRFLQFSKKIINRLNPQVQKEKQEPQNQTNSQKSLNQNKKWMDEHVKILNLMYRIDKI